MCRKQKHPRRKCQQSSKTLKATPIPIGWLQTRRATQAGREKLNHPGRRLLPGLLLEIFTSDMGLILVQFLLVCFRKHFFDSMGLISKTKPLSIEFGFGLGKESAEHDSEGRLENILVFKPKMKIYEREKIK